MNEPSPGASGGEPLDVDEAFAAIIADWNRETPVAERFWPVEEDADPEITLSRGPGPAEGPVDVVPAGPGVGFGEIRLPEPVPAPEEERYVPPEPPPLPRGDLISRLAWAGALGGPLFLLIAVIAWRTAPQILLMLAIVAFVAGFVTLIARMPQHRDDDGDGAVV